MTQAHIPNLCLEMLWGRKRLGCEVKAGSSPLSATREEHDPEKSMKLVPITLCEAQDPAVIRDLPGIFSCTHQCLSLGSSRS